MSPELLAPSSFPLHKFPFSYYNRFSSYIYLNSCCSLVCWSTNFISLLDLGRSNALLESQNYIRNITVRELRQSELGREVLEELLSPNKVSCQEEERPLEHPFFWGAWVCQGETANVTFPMP